MSLPAEKAPGTPRNTCTRMPASASAARSASLILAYMARVSAFFLSGRFIRIDWIAPRRSTMTCSVKIGFPHSARKRGARREQALAAADDGSPECGGLAQQIVAVEAAERYPLGALVSKRGAGQI